jgi:hypothetical protein
MARTGVYTILMAARLICKMVGQYGTNALNSATTPEFTAAVVALVTACQVFEALDNDAQERDRIVEPGGDYPKGS